MIKNILKGLSYGMASMFIFDILYNFFPTPIYQYIFLVYFILIGVLFFNQKWVAFLPFNQKWRTILLSLVIIFIHILIFLFFTSFNKVEILYDFKSSLFFILLFSFNFTYLTVSTLINIFSLPTTPVFDNIQNERIIAQKVQENLIPNILPNPSQRLQAP